jgi:hypothetical protein
LDLQQLKEQFDGKRVKYVGIRGATDGPVGKVWRVTKGGVWVSLADGSRQQWHPEDISVVSGRSYSTNPQRTEVSAMNSTATAAASVPAGFALIPESTDAFVGGEIHAGPAAGDVVTTWTSDEGIRVHFGNSVDNGMTVTDALALARDLRRVLEGVAGL